MNIFEIIAFIGGGLVIISAIPQAFNLYKSKTAGNVSLPMFLLLFTANVCWFTYGIHLSDKAIIITNLFAGLIAFSNIILIFKFRQ